MTTTADTVPFYRGVVPILPTPFHDNEDLDLDSLTCLLAAVRAAGADSATVLGVLGESGALTDTESDAVVRHAVSCAEGLPLVVGASRPGTRATIDAVTRAAAAGAAGAMVAPPTVDGLPADQILRFYRDVAAAAPIPIIVQDHPASTRMHLPMPLLHEIVEVPGIAAVKCEAVPTAPKVRALKSAWPALPVLTGLGALYGATDLRAGADGFNTGFAFPEVLRAMVDAHRAGDHSRLDDLVARFLPLIVIEQQPGPAIRKEVWRKRGVLSSSRVRSPATSAGPSVSAELDVLLARALPGTELTHHPAVLD